MVHHEVFIHKVINDSFYRVFCLSALGTWIHFRGWQHETADPLCFWIKPFVIAHVSFKRYPSPSPSDNPLPPLSVPLLLSHPLATLTATMTIHTHHLPSDGSDVGFGTTVMRDVIRLVCGEKTGIFFPTMQFSHRTDCIEPDSFNY